MYPRVGQEIEIRRAEGESQIRCEAWSSCRVGTRKRWIKVKRREM